MANRNGLNHKVRGFKGVGWNRTLPAAFGFGNGIKPDGINDYMDVPRLVNYVLPDKLTIELWLYKDIANSAGYLFSIYDDLKAASLNFVTLGSSRLIRFDSESNSLVGEAHWLSSEDGQKAHCVWCIDRNENSSKFYLNGVLTQTMTSILSFVPNYIKTFNIGRYRTGGFYSKTLMSEFKIYSTILQPNQITLNYNNGIGNNPSITEYLLVWYGFEKFEILDFSKDIDGSMMSEGIKDLSGNNNHARAVNMDTDPSSSGYVLKPF